MKHKKRLYPARLHIVQALYQMEIAHTSLPRILADFPSWQKGLADENALKHFEAIVSDVVQRRDQWDQAIAPHLPASWPLERLNKILLAILRAGCSEFARQPSHQQEIIRDYLDIARRLLDQKSAAMIIAILDKIKNEKQK